MSINRFALTGKVALVAGASRGIGRAIALGLAGAGADAALCSRRLENVEPVAAECEDRSARVRGSGRRH